MKKSRALLGQVSDVDVRLLRVFRSIVNCGGIAAAELELNIGLSTVSRHLKDLETRLGLTLCTRGRGGFALTQEGQRVYEETLRLLAALDAFRSGIDDIHGRLGGTARIGIFDKTASNPACHIDQALARFRLDAPEVSLSVHVGSINDIERRVLEGEFQIGIIPAHRSSPLLEYQDLFGEKMLLYCGRGHMLYGGDDRRLDWERVRHVPFAVLGEHSPNMEVSYQHQLSARATGFDQEAIATLILSNAFLGFLPEHYGAVFQQAGRMRPLAPDRFHYECRFVSLRRRSPQGSRLVQLLESCVLEAHAARPVLA